MADFDEENISTITCHTVLKKPILTEYVSRLLPVLQEDVKPEQKEFLHPGSAGVILFLRHRDLTLGCYDFLRKNDVFRNSISMDMSIAEKMVNIKWSDKSVHMCGIKKPQQIHEVMGCLQEKLRTIQSFLSENSNKSLHILDRC